MGLDKKINDINFAPVIVDRRLRNVPESGNQRPYRSWKSEYGDMEYSQFRKTRL